MHGRSGSSSVRWISALTSVQSKLHGFAYHRFRRYISGYGGARSLTWPGKPWHLLEAYMELRGARRQKCYKEWLFSRAGAAADTLVSARSREAQASFCGMSLASTFDGNVHRYTWLPLIARSESVARHRTLSSTYSRRTLTPPRTWLSESTRISRGDTPAKCCPDSPCGKGWRSWRRSFAFHLPILRSRLPPDAERAFSTMHTGMLLHASHGDLRRLYPDDESAAVLSLTLLTVRDVASRVLEQSRSEKAMSGVFLAYGEKSETA